MDHFVYYALILFILLLLGIIAFCVKRIAKLVGFIEELNLQVEESLDVLDTAHKEIIAAAGHDVIEDNGFIRGVVRSLFNARDAVHKVAEKLVSFDKSAPKVEKLDSSEK